MKLVCYCFSYSAEDIARDVLENRGISMIEAKIVAARQNGACQCEIKNPRKTWCLAEVRRVAERARKLLR